MNLSAAAQSVLAQPSLQGALNHCQKSLELARQGLLERATGDWLGQLEQQAGALAELRRDDRLTILRQTAGGMRSPSDALEALEAIRWLERATYHTWRLCHYLIEEGNKNGGLMTMPAHSDG
jgi:phosphate:Na+ symporter